MLENWCYEQSILERLSKHVSTGATLPDDLRKQLVAAKKAFAPYITLRSTSRLVGPRDSCTSGSFSLAIST